MSAKYLELLLKESKPVSVVTNDGRHFLAKLASFDQKLNLVLRDCQERIYSPGEPVSSHSLGLFFLRGDNVGLIGEVDPDLDAQIDYSAIKTGPLRAA